MTIACTHYKDHELRAYSKQEFPLYRDPYAGGARRFSAVVRINSDISPDEPEARYRVAFAGDAPDSADTATSLAVEFGKAILDGTVKANVL
jgi:hypothetical protein